MEQKILNQGAEKAAEKIGISSILMGGFGDIMNVTTAMGAFSTSQDEGEHIAVSSAKAVGSFVASEMFYGGMSQAGIGIIGSLGASIGFTAVTAGAGLLANRWEQTAKDSEKGYNNLKTLGSGHFDMTKTGYTMRQRSLNAIHSNGADLNSAFGNEARNFYLGI